MSMQTAQSHLQAPMHRFAACKESQFQQPSQNNIYQSNQVIMQYKVQECQLLQQINQLQQVQIRQLGQSNSHCQYLQECVAGFWDFENIPFKSSNFCSLTQFYKFVQSNTDAFLGRHVLNQKMTLYGKFKDIRTNICEDACDLGIDTVNVESKRKEESVDKRIIADIGMFAATCAEQQLIGHIVLISGDRDYGYVLSQVRCRKHIGSIILFHNENTKQTLIHHAHATFCILKRKVPTQTKKKVNKKKKKKNTVCMNNENYSLVWRQKSDGNRNNMQIVDSKHIVRKQFNYAYCRGPCRMLCGIIVMLVITLLMEMFINVIVADNYIDEFDENNDENYMNIFYWNDSVFLQRECELSEEIFKLQYSDVLWPLNISDMICRNVGLSPMIIEQSAFI